MAYLVNLEQFYGPMDLLLYLIEKKEMDIYDVPLAPIIDQFIDYIDNTGDIELENRTDFLVMASYLMNVKSHLLLPRLMDGPEGEETNAEDDPRDILLQHLLIYKKYKEAAQCLSSSQRKELEKIFFRPSATLPVTDGGKLKADAKSLYQAMLALRQRVKTEKEYVIPLDDVKVEAKMQELIHMLKKNDCCLNFSELLLTAESKKEILAFFLGLLELVKLQMIEARQKEDNDIMIILQVKS